MQQYYYCLFFPVQHEVSAFANHSESEVMPGHDSQHTASVLNPLIECMQEYNRPEAVKHEGV